MIVSAPSLLALSTLAAQVVANNHPATGVILANAALTILEDELELGGGIFTPACLGQGVVDRLNASGFRFETETRA